MPRKADPLTITELKRMRSKAAKDPAYSEIRADGKCAGLNAQCRRGRVEFKYRYKSPATGQRRTVTLGVFGDITLDYAREEAGKLRRQVAQEVDPHELKAEEERAALTVKQGVELYLADLKERAETGAGKRGKWSGYGAMKGLLEKKVVPRLGTKRAVDVTSDDVRRWHRGIKAKVAANRALTAFSAVYGLLDRRELVPPGTNPCRYVERNRENGARRPLTAAELEALGEALARAESEGEGHPSALLAIRFLALTGMRPVELLGHGSKPRRNGREGLRWEDVDLDRQLVYLADSKAGGRQTRVIGAAAVDILRSAKPADAEPEHCVFPGAMRPDKPLVGLGKIRAKLWKAAKLKATPEGRCDAYSLRHTFATIAARLQNGRFAGVTSDLLGHGAGVARSITQRYVGQDPEALVPAADAVAGEIARLLGLTEPAKVLRHPAVGARKGRRK